MRVHGRGAKTWARMVSPHVTSYFLCGIARSVGLVWVRKVRAGDLWITCQTREQSRVWDHDNTEMSGDNEETQTAEETAVDEKVTVQRISSLAAIVPLLTLL